jgi:hypothetical protein
MIFSIPTDAMWHGASAIPRSAFPSFVHTTKPPVSATAKFIPVSVASGGEEVRAQMLARRRRERRRIGKSLRRPEVLVERCRRPPPS